MGSRGLSLGLVLSLFVGVGVSACSDTRCSEDVVTKAAQQRLGLFATWVQQHKVNAVIGEVGWPEDSQWAGVARSWGATAKEAGLPVYVWAAAPWWQPTDPLAFYRADQGSQNLSLDSGPARDFESMLHDGLSGGVGLAEATFGSDLGEGSYYSTARPGRIGEDHTYPSAASLGYLKARGISKVRLAVTWERLQRRLNGPLDPVELAHLKRSLQAARDLGMQVVLDLHNYGRYATVVKGRRTVLVLGGPGLPAAHLADVWRRLAHALRTEPAVTALGLMNEPHDLPGGEATWHKASLAAARAVRSVNPKIPIWVGGYDWSAVSAFTAAPWIPSGLGPVVYEAHQYFDADHSGKYRSSYADTGKALEATGVAVGVCES